MGLSERFLCGFPDRCDPERSRWATGTVELPVCDKLIFDLSPVKLLALARRDAQ